MDDILTRGIERNYPSAEALAKRLAAGPMTIYHGIDPTAPTIHLGHVATLLKLKDFALLGHKIILMFGDFTATIGDPTDKLSARKVLTSEEVANNMRDYKSQVKMVFSTTPVEFRSNSEWWDKMSVRDLLGLATEFTDRDVTERDMFVERKKRGEPVYLNELLYPLFQGYDSVALEVDAEIGGNDQTFNMLAGRDLMAHRGKEKFVITTKLLTDSAGKKMGKTEGNTASLVDPPNEMFGKIMSWSDDLLPTGFEILTRLPTKECQEILAGHPKEAKIKLATEIVSLLHSDDLAQKAKDNFEKVFSGGSSVPEELEELKSEGGELLSVILVNNKIVSSKSEFTRLVDGGGVEIIGEGKVTDEKITITKPVAVRIGKHRFVKINIA